MLHVCYFFCYTTFISLAFCTVPLSFCMYDMIEVMHINRDTDFIIVCNDDCIQNEL